MQSLHLYKPNDRITGSACSFWVRAEDGTLWGQMIKQAQKGKGAFAKNRNNPKGKITFKLSATEVAAMIRAAGRNKCVKTGNREGFYHKSPNQVTQIFFGPYLNAEGRQLGFSLKAIRQPQDDSTDKVSVVFAFTFDELFLLREYLSEMLRESWHTAPSTDKEPEAAQEAEPAEAAQETPPEEEQFESPAVEADDGSWDKGDDSPDSPEDSTAPAKTEDGDPW